MPTPEPPQLVAANGVANDPHDAQACASSDDADAYELKDHEFTLLLDDTVEFPVASSGLRRGAPPQPLPRWAAASRALLDDWRETEAADPETTVEITPARGATPAARNVSADAALRDRLAELTQRIQAREVYCQEIERALVASVGRARGQAFRIAELEAELELLQARVTLAVTPLVEQPAKKRVKKSVHAASPMPRDDLKRIRGIGPSFAARLHKLGFRSYASVAAWSAADVTRVAEKLGIDRARITRDSWMKQARALSKHSKASAKVR